MREELEHIAQIDAYLDGKMSSEEILLFEEEIENNAELKEAIHFQREANQLLIIGELHDLDKKVKSYNYKTPSKNTYNYKTGTLGLAGMLLLAGLLIYLLSTTKPDSLGISKKVKLTPTPVETENSVIKKEKDKPLSIKSPKNVYTPAQNKKTNPVKKASAKKVASDTATTTVKTPDPVVTIDTTSSITESLEIPKEKIDTTTVNTTSSENKIEHLPDTIHKKETTEKTETEKPTSFSYDLAFSPSQGQLLKWPVKENFEGEILLYNTNGQIIYEKQFNGYENIEWDGITRSGNLISFGVYPLIIRTFNGEKPIQGSVTVVE